MKFLAIDPGPHTGMSLWQDTTMVNAFVPSKLSGPGGIIHMLTRFIHPGQIDFVVCEEFIGSSNTNAEKATIEIIGFIKGWCINMDIPCKMQVPAVRKGYVQFAKNYPAGTNYIPADIRKHALDSMAHGLRYLHKDAKIWNPNI